MTVAELAKRFGIHTQQTAQWATEQIKRGDLDLAEIREMLGNGVALVTLATEWPGGARRNGGNTRQLVAALATATRKAAMAAMTPEQRADAMMWR